MTCESLQKAKQVRKAFGLVSEKTWRLLAQTLSKSQVFVKVFLSY